MPAFRSAAGLRAVLELDVKLTKDGVPVVIHDDTVDRTTPCTGDVASFTLAALSGCRTDVLGSPGSPLPSRTVEPSVAIPTLAEALAYARDSGASVNLEIKNLPTDGDFDTGSAYANRVMDVVIASGLPPARLIVQSFWPPNLDVARTRLPAAPLSLLTLAQSNDGGPAFAASRGYEWVSPGWPIGASYVQEAHALGRKVVPYTLDRADEIRAAAAAGVDAVITDDPAMARGALGLPAPGTAAPPAGGAAPPRTCRSRRVITLHLRAPRGQRIRRATVRVGGRRVRVLGRRRPRARIDLRGRPAGRVRVRIAVVTRDGRTHRSTRTYRTCRPRARSG